MTIDEFNSYNPKTKAMIRRCIFTSWEIAAALPLDGRKERQERERQERESEPCIRARHRFQFIVPNPAMRVRRPRNNYQFIEGESKKLSE